MSHTPGPLKYSFYETNKRTHAGEWVIYDRNGDVLKQVNAEAYARLFTAAPELLEACETALDYISEHGDGFSTRREITKNKLRAAIAKAKGQP